MFCILVKTKDISYAHTECWIRPEKLNVSKDCLHKGDGAHSIQGLTNARQTFMCNTDNDQWRARDHANIRDYVDLKCNWLVSPLLRTWDYYV